MSEDNSNQEGKERVEKGGRPKVKPKFTGTMTPPVVTVGEPKEKKEAKPRVTKSDSRFVLLKELEPASKMPLQCKQIVGILSAAEGKTLTRTDLLTAMTPIISTRQPIERILGFYQSRLVSGDWVRIEPIVAPVVPGTAPAATQTADAPVADEQGQVEKPADPANII